MSIIIGFKFFFVLCVCVFFYFYESKINTTLGSSRKSKTSTICVNCFTEHYRVCVQYDFRTYVVPKNPGKKLTLCFRKTIT